MLIRKTWDDRFASKVKGGSGGGRGLRNGGDRDNSNGENDFEIGELIPMFLFHLAHTLQNTLQKSHVPLFGGSGNISICASDRVMWTRSLSSTKIV